MTSIIKQIKQQWQNIAIIMLYIVGLLGLISPYQELFTEMSVAQILICSGLVLYQYLFNKILMIRFIVLSIFGLVIEIIGIKTGFPFGDYYYGNKLGIYMLNVPLVIALNWAIVIFCSKSLLKNLIKTEIKLSLLTACFATSLDYFIEKTASDFEFWFWRDNLIPLNNYISWFIIAFLGSLILGNQADQTNTRAITNVLSMYIFFFLLSLFKL